MPVSKISFITRWGLKESKEFVEAAPKLLKAEDMVFFPGAKDLTARNEEAARLLGNAGAKRSAKALSASPQCWTL